MKMNIKILGLSLMLIAGQVSNLPAENKAPNMKERLKKEVLKQIAFPKQIKSGTEQKINVSFTVNAAGEIELINIESKDEQLKNHIQKELEAIKLRSQNYLTDVVYKMSFTFIAQ